MIVATHTHTHTHKIEMFQQKKNAHGKLIYYYFFYSCWNDGRGHVGNSSTVVAHCDRAVQTLHGQTLRICRDEIVKRQTERCRETQSWNNVQM